MNELKEQNFKTKLEHMPAYTIEEAIERGIRWHANAIGPKESLARCIYLSVKDVIANRLGPFVLEGVLPLSIYKRLFE